VDTEEGVPAQHFHVPILEVEGFMQSRYRWVNGRLVEKGGVDGGLIIRRICDREVGQSGNADGWRLSSRADGRFGSRVLFRNGDLFELEGSGSLRFEISVGRSEGCGNGSCRGTFLVRDGLLRLPGLEYGWGREAIPTTLP